MYLPGQSVSSRMSKLSDGDYGEDVAWRTARDKARTALATTPEPDGER